MIMGGWDDQGYVAVPGGRIWYGRCGTGDALVVIHGGPGMSHLYLDPLKRLGGQLIFYDQLDAGQSVRPNDPANWNMPRFLQEIDALRTHLGLESFAIFGNSWGGCVAAAYAATRPRGLTRLVLSSPLIDTRTWLRDGALYRAALPQNVREALEADPSDEAAALVFYERHFCRCDPWPDYVRRTFEDLNETCYRGMWGPNEFTCDGVLRDYDGSGDLAKISVPTLVTCGEFDEAAPASCRRFAGMIPSSRCVVVDGASHLAFAEVPDAYLPMVQAFLLEDVNHQDCR